jgi:rhamnopyranosyl-N-acetylglucosaminyl-diphospho-decaprenol beta-1,3/1,4-galactofuranosyltransferase
VDKKVIAIVVTYNRKSLLNKVINRLLEQSYELHKIIIIDNNSSDGTNEMLSELLLPEKIVYYNTGCNLGGAGGFYEGFKISSKYNYDYLWLMDDDFLPDINCLENMLIDKPTGIVQPIRYNLDGTCAELSPLTYDLRSFFKINPKGISVKEYIKKNGILRHPIKIEAISFEGPLISKAAIEKVGLPEPRFFIFCDDIEYAIRARKNNISIICNPNARAIRLLINNQKNDLTSWKGYFMLRNLFYLHTKYGENFFVRKKIILLSLGYVFYCLLKGNFKQLKVIYNAYKDSFNLSNNEKFKP